MEGLVWSHGGSTTVILEFMSFNKLGSAVSVDFSIMTLTSFAPPFLQLYSWSVVVDLCLWFHQLLVEGSMTIVGVSSNLITGEGQSVWAPSMSLTCGHPYGFLGISLKLL